MFCLRTVAAAAFVVILLIWNCITHMYSVGVIPLAVLFIYSVNFPVSEYADDDDDNIVWKSL